jgi:hypothetical protein
MPQVVRSLQTGARKRVGEGSMDWFWLLVVVLMFVLFASLVGLCAKLR